MEEEKQHKRETIRKAVMGKKRKATSEDSSKGPQPKKMQPHHYNKGD